MNLRNNFALVLPRRALPKNASEDLKKLVKESDTGEGLLNRAGDNRWGFGEALAHPEVLVRSQWQLSDDEQKWVEDGFTPGAKLLVDLAGTE